MPRFSKRTQRQRGGPDPVAQCISTDLEACRANSNDEHENAETGNSDEVSSARFTVNSKDADLSAGEEFIQAKPNDFPAHNRRETRTDRESE